MQNLQQKESSRRTQSFQFSQGEQAKSRFNVNSTTFETQLRNGPNAQSGSRIMSPAGQNTYTVVPGTVTTTASNRLFYSQVYGKQEQGVSVFYNQLTPGQIHRKSVQQLEYQNGVLLHQLQERDEVIALLKSNWKPSQLPINDELVKSLNLQLAQKNVLIEQIHRSLAQFEETVKREKVQLPQICVQEFHNLQVLIVKHEHYPILITQRLIDTSRTAQTIYIKDTTIIQEYIMRLEQSYKEVTILREKIVWFEKEHSRLESLNANLQVQLQQISVTQNTTIQQQVTVLQQQINVYKTEITQYQQQITVLQQQINVYKTDISQYQQQITVLQQQINVFKTEINSLRIQIQQGQQGQGAANNQLTNEITNLKQQINVYITEINTYKQQISTLNITIQNDASRYKQEIDSLRQEIDRLRREGTTGVNVNVSKYELEIRELRTIITRYEQEIVILKGKIDAGSYGQGDNQWELDSLKRENQRLKNQNQKLRQENSNQEDQINRLNGELIRLKGRISRLENELTQSSEWKVKYEQTVITIRKLQQQISEYEYTSSSSSNQWKIKYQTLESQHYKIVNQLQLYKSEVTRLQELLDSRKQTDHSQTNQWRIKYETLESKHYQLVNQIEIYKSEIARLQEIINSSKQTGSGDGEWKIKYDVLYQEHYQLVQQFEIYKIEITRLQEIISSYSQNNEWEIKYNQLYQNFSEAEQYIQNLLIQIQEMTVIINNYKIQIEQGDQGNSGDAGLHDRIRELEAEILRLRDELSNYDRNMQDADAFINELQVQITQLNITIEELTIQIKQYIVEIGEFNNHKSDFQIRYRHLEETLISTRTELELVIKRLNEEILILKRELAEKSAGNKDWENEKKQLVEKYEKQLRERWEQLQKSEEYIRVYTQESQGIIAYLEQRIRELEAQLDQLNHQTIVVPDQVTEEYLYKIDSRYEQIRRRLLTISQQTTQSITAESQMWESYRVSRQQELQVITQTINESLSYMSQIEQAIVVKRQELHRLDFTKLGAIFDELERLHKGKAELQGAIKEEFESRFYGVVKSVGTPIPQN